ncbi:AfsR/SARP family transcriptional regulator [Streptomyces albipurpureus]|uniref:NB-ARC domain-containing protein n=1 Tax=Streptomyces albipurpureus TaxID=2897419 RepID=A0ABT0UZD9_9ACTN|nr:AfsR/SARP family transcriptional regulator [Streptomyces sp. CWNU-1]MCM2393811.1 NB-ARC domain-containing protein [Streptomyces sp. CWNU-1]
MRFRVLGPVSLSPRTPSAAKPRALLATLLVQAGEVVPAHSLIDELWGTEPPRTATTTLQVYVSQLRKVLAEGDDAAATTGGLLVTRPPGYLLQIPHQEGQFDLPQFERLRSDGRTAYQESDFARSSHLLGEALALWAGPALSGIPHGVRLESAAIRLDELRLEVLEQRIVADLRLGRHQELAGELLALANENPLRETLHAHLMVALYRTGRGSDALRVYGRLRHSLVEELGVEPGPTLARLHERVLRRDPSLDWRAARAGVAANDRPTPPASPGVTATAPAPVPVPKPVLPAAAPGFAGRHEELAYGEKVLRGGGGRQPARLLAISGRAGAGKTVLALRLAHRLAGQFPDGQLLVGLRGPQGRPLSPTQAGALLLRRLIGAAPGATAPTDPGELADRLQRALHGRRMLLVIDDVSSEEQVRPLLPPGDGSAVILIGRRTAAALDGAEHLVLDAVRPDDALELLRVAGGQRMAENPAATAEIARLCGYLPLALRVAAAALTARPHTTAAELAERLRDERTRLGVLREGDLDLRSSLLTGYQEATPATQRAFRLLTLAPAPDFAGWTAGALLGITPGAADEVAEELVRAQLLEARPGERPARYGFHSLLRVLAVELRDAADQEHGQPPKAMERLCHAYLALARYADRRLAPGRNWRVPALSGAGAAMGDAYQGTLLDRAAIVGSSPLGWFGKEATGLVETVRQAHAAGLWPLVGELADSATGYFHACAAWDDWEETHRLALDAALRTGNTAAEAVVRYSLGDLAWQRREGRRALDLYTAAQHCFDRVGDRIGSARCRIGVADILLGQGRLGAAARRYGRALDQCLAGGDLWGGVAALNGLALVNLRKGRRDTATGQLVQCRRWAERLGDRRWAEYTRRTAARMAQDAPANQSQPSRNGQPDQRSGAVVAADDPPYAVEVRPGMWLIGAAVGRGGRSHSPALSR